MAIFSVKSFGRSVCLSVCLSDRFTDSLTGGRLVIPLDKIVIKHNNLGDYLLSPVNLSDRLTDL
jgi:hypothetical protein